MLERQMIFENTQEALQPMLELLKTKNYALNNTTLVIIGTEGVMLGAELANALKVPLECLLTQTIYAPLNNECQIAVVSEDMEIVVNESLLNAFDISLDYVYGEAQRQYEEAIIPKRYKLRKGENLNALKNKDILLFDMGIESGLRVGVAIKTCMNLDAKSICVITPIMPKDIYQHISDICDDVCCPFVLDYFVNTTHYFPTLKLPSQEEFDKIVLNNKASLFSEMHN